MARPRQRPGPASGGPGTAGAASRATRRPAPDEPGVSGASSGTFVGSALRIISGSAGALNRRAAQKDALAISLSRVSLSRPAIKGLLETPARP